MPQFESRELLGETPGRDAHAPVPVDLTVAEVATRFGRRSSTVRLWVERGAFPGAYRFRGREWRIPPAALTAGGGAKTTNPPITEVVAG